MNFSLNKPEAIARKNEGMEQAADNAERSIQGWNQRASNAFAAYVQQLIPGQTFLAEDARVWAMINKGIEEPPSLRAWGSIVTNAAKTGIIERAGYAATSNPKAHRTPATLWRVKTSKQP